MRITNIINKPTRNEVRVNILLSRETPKIGFRHTFRLTKKQGK
jgi:hypothetical protein